MCNRTLYNGLKLQAGVNMALVFVAHIGTTTGMKYKDFAFNIIGRLACRCNNFTGIYSPQCET